MFRTRCHCLFASLTLLALGCDAVSEGELRVSGEAVLSGLDERPDNATCFATGEPAQLLSETGCVEPADPALPAAGLVPFSLNVKLWSDRAEKRRSFAIPNGESVVVLPSGDWEFPPGSVLMKTFVLDESPIETRFLMHLPEEGNWLGVTYEWNEEGTDATLLESGKRVELASGDTWEFPSRGQCMRCHRATAGRALGPETAQLNRDFTYPSTGRTANQLATLSHVGLLTEESGDELPAPESLPRLPALDEVERPAEERARAYIHANCSYCHRPDDPGACPGDFRYSTSFAEMGVCNQRPPFGGFGLEGNLLTPGDVDRSIIYQLMNRRGFPQMPPLATFVVDHQAVDVVEEWIDSIDSCPELL